MHPALADERDVADDPRGREPRQVPHHRVLQVLGLRERDPPVLAERDHVAQVEVVRRDAGLVLQREAQVEQGGGRVVDAAHQHTLVADVAHAGVEHRPGGCTDCGSKGLGVVDVGVDRQRDPARAGGRGHPTDALDDLVGQPVLRQAHQRLGRQPDVADVLDLEQPHQERLEVLPRHVRDVAAADDDIAHRRRAGKVVEHRGVPVDRLEVELQLGHHRRRVADQVHARAVPAVLRAGRQQLGEHLGGVAVGEPLGHPHVVLVQRVAGGERVTRPVGAAVAEHRQHVAAHRVGVEGGGELGPCRRQVTVVEDAGGGHHRVHHLRRHEHRHGGPLGLVALEVGVEPLVQQVAHQRPQLAQVLHAVRALPLDVGPLGRGDVAPAGQPAPVGLDQRAPAVGVRLLDHLTGRVDDVMGPLDDMTRTLDDLGHTWHHTGRCPADQAERRTF